MKLAFISDTHNFHKDVVFDDYGDILFHCGDITQSGSKTEVIRFLDWYEDVPFRHKVLIGGNHDLYLDAMPATLIKELCWGRGIEYLEHEACEIEGVTIFGSPFTPRFFEWGFLYDSHIDGYNLWQCIPEDIDVLITHGPPKYHCDAIYTSVSDPHVGCRYLMDRVWAVGPKVHAFGHIHEGYGEDKSGEIHFINCAFVDHKYRPSNKPIFVEL